jgi:hypothetical protein
MILGPLVLKSCLTVFFFLSFSDSHPWPVKRGLMMRVERILRSGPGCVDFIVAFSLANLELLLTFKGGYYDRRLGGEFTIVFRIHSLRSLTSLRS